MGRFFMKEKAVLQKNKQTAFLCSVKIYKKSLDR